MLSQIQIGGIDIRLVTAWMGDCCLGIVWNDDLWDATKEAQSVNVRFDPAGETLRVTGLGEGIVASPQYRHKDLSLFDLTGVRIDNGDGLAGVVHKELLTGPIWLAKTEIELLYPKPIALTKSAVLIPFGIVLFILIPEQLKGHPFAFELTVDVFHREHGTAFG
jgi:hypothetical protein